MVREEDQKMEDDEDLEESKIPNAESLSKDASV
jgi:hypothetical protein